MNSFLAWTKKEILEGARSYRFLLIAGAIAFFAFLDPAMLKILPLILKSQFGADMAALLVASRDSAFATFLKDLFEILTFILCISLGGIVARERKARIFVIPATKGASFPGIILAKTVTYALVNVLAILPLTFLSYAYAGILFPGQTWSTAVPLAAAASLSLYFVYTVCLVVLASAVMPSPAGAGILSLALSFGLPAIASLFRIGKYFPSWLALGAPGAQAADGGSLLLPALVSVAAIVLCLMGAVGALKNARL